MQAYRLFTGTGGDSHVQRGTVTNAPHNATTIAFRDTPADSAKGLHTAPSRQYVIMLSGVVQFATRGGESFTTFPGDVLLVEDVTGSGHAWRIVGDQAWRRACVFLAPDADPGFLLELPAQRFD